MYQQTGGQDNAAYNAGSTCQMRALRMRRYCYIVRRKTKVRRETLFASSNLYACARAGRTVRPQMGTKPRKTALWSGHYLPFARRNLPNQRVQTKKPVI